VCVLLLLSRQHRIGSNRSSGSKHGSWGGRALARVIFTFFAGTPRPSVLQALPASDPLASSVISFLLSPFLARFTARSCPTPAHSRKLYAYRPFVSEVYRFRGKRLDRIDNFLPATPTTRSPEGQMHQMQDVGCLSVHRS
jgi:hypothetical protein